MPHPTPHRARSSASAVLWVAGLLVLAVAAILVYDGRVFASRRSASAARLQRLAGGLGMGATVCPRWCFVNFDPRIERCTCAEQPLPGGYCYCPEHGATISFFDADRPGLAPVVAHSRGSVSPRPRTAGSARRASLGEARPREAASPADPHTRKTSAWALQRDFDR